MAAQRGGGSTKTSSSTACGPHVFRRLSNKKKRLRVRNSKKGPPKKELRETPTMVGLRFTTPNAHCPPHTTPNRAATPATPPASQTPPQHIDNHQLSKLCGPGGPPSRGRRRLLTWLPQPLQLHSAAGGNGRRDSRRRRGRQWEDRHRGGGPIRRGRDQIAAGRWPGCLRHLNSAAPRTTMVTATGVDHGEEGDRGAAGPPSPPRHGRISWRAANGQANFAMPPPQSQIRAALLGQR